MNHKLPILLLVLLLPSAPAYAEWQARLVARTDPSQPFRAQPVQARVGEPVEMAVIVIDPDGDILGDVDRVALRRRARAPQGPLPEDADITWLRVIPRLRHQDTPPPNPDNPSFSNTVLYGPDHGDWLGYDTLEYDTRALQTDRNTRREDDRLIVTGSRPTLSQEDFGGAGSNWFAAEIWLPSEGVTVRTPDGDDTDRYGLVEQVQRISFRTDDGYLGWLGTYFNVPFVFGSAGSSDEHHQAERYVGADCADALVGALRASGHSDAEYTSVSGIGSLTDAISDVLVIDALGAVTDLDGNPVEVRWGEDIQPGDLMAIKFVREGVESRIPRSWDHIGAMVEDRGPMGEPNGVLDGWDIVRHSAHHGLDDYPITRLGGMRVRFWRWE